MGPAAVALTVVLANLGNVNVPGCSEQAYKLCQRPVEERATEALRALRPDLAALVEVLPADLCRRAPSTNPDNLCSRPLEPASQVQRLLGRRVRWACDRRYGWDCLAVSQRVALERPLDTRPVPPSCEDDGFTVSVGTARVHGWPVTVAVAHPSSSDVDCRADQVRDLFEAGMPRAGAAIVAGDFNLDPYREDDASVAAFREGTRGYALASTDAFTSFPAGPSQLDPGGRTLDNDVALDAPGPFEQRSIDHVLVRGGVKGSCAVRRVDGGGGMDHRAQACRLRVPTPRMRLRREGCRVRVRLRPIPAGLRGVRIGGVADRKAPYSVRRARGGVVAVRALLANGRGPLLRKRVARC